MANSLDLTTLLTPRQRDKTITTLIKNLFNRHLSKPETIALFGYVGETSDKLRISESDLERQINQLIPFIHTTHANEEVIYSWQDIIQKLVALGVEYSTVNQWMKTKSYNFVPPIDLDKFCNYHEYYWIGGWVANDITSQQIYIDLGIAKTPIQLRDIFSTWNNSLIDPEYYVISKPQIDDLGNEITPIPDITGWSDWSISNLWIHRDDAITFLQAHPSGVRGFEQLIQATRPIIEYSSRVKLNTRLDLIGQPSDVGTLNIQSKTRKNQLPLFDIYNHDGSHSGKASAIFYYQESQTSDIDPVLERRITRDTNNDFIFEHSLIHDDKSLLFYKMFDEIENNTTPSTWNYYTIWRGGSEVTVKNKKYDESGNLINKDKFVNYKNYYWVGALPNAPKPLYNLAGDPEYNVIEHGGSSDWSVYNSWVHVSQLNRSDLPLYIQATRPIIEFNVLLEPELKITKTKYQQLPKFKLYIQVITNADYVEVKYIPTITANDAYTDGVVFARVEDLAFKSVVLGNSDVLLSCFNENDEYYIQSLIGGQYTGIKDGIAYGYIANTVSYNGVGNGQLTLQTIDTNSYPEILTLTYNGTTFDVIGSVSGLHASGITIDTMATDSSGITFYISRGVIDYEVGDTFIVDLRGYIYQPRQYYVKLDGVYRTLELPRDILGENQLIELVDADPSIGDGVWVVPDQLRWNINNETRTSIKEGDLYYHFLSIISSQIGLIGSASGNNNWRQLPVQSIGNGGLIKQYDGDLGLLISLLLQDGISIPSLIEFAQQSYASIGSTIKEFVETRVPVLLTNGDFTSPDIGDSLDVVVLDEFKKFFTEKNPVISATTTLVDDYVVMPFYDTTSAIKNMVVTLPYLGLTPCIKPQKVFNDDLNMWMLLHHDGHYTQLSSYPIDVAKKIVQMEFPRSQGQHTTGIISGFKWPKNPYRGQFWFNTSTSELYIYNVITDVGDLSLTPTYGSYAYDRVTGDIWQYNGTWDYMGNDASVTSLPWMLVRLDLIMHDLELAFENELYNNCPPISQRIDSLQYESNPNFSKYMQQRFERFGVKYGVADVYATSFDSNNAFTWNYKSVLLPGAMTYHNTWQDAYIDVYGTSRPDRYPWLICGFSNEADFISAAITDGVLPSGTTSFTSDMWVEVAEFVRNLRVSAGKPSQLSVEISTGQLLPPFGLSTESLISVPPSSANDIFEFGSCGPIERYWKLTSDYLYGLQETYFKIDPLHYVQHTWGVKNTSLIGSTNGDYSFNKQFGRKLSVSEFQLHGDSLTELAQQSWINVSLVDIPTFDYTYTFTCVSRQDGIFKLVVENHDAGLDIGATLDHPMFLNIVDVDPTKDLSSRVLTYNDKFITVVITPTARGFFHGDQFIVTVHPDSTIDVVVHPQLTYQGEGFSQLYVQANRLIGIETELSFNRSLYNNWNVKLGYRVGGMINTDNLIVSTKNTPIVGNAIKVILKENKFYGSYRLNALRVQLVNRGSTAQQNGFTIPATGQSGIPGDDWVFRIDTFNTKNTLISWYEYDKTIYNTFVALNGERTAVEWKRFTKPIQRKTFAAPFLVTGIQNLITFIFGYADALTDEGWVFNNDLDPILDSSTGRQTGFQLLVEQFIVQQFSSVDAGSAFVFNPFNNKVWFKTSHGVVAPLTNKLALDDRITAFALDEKMQVIPNTKMRVFREDESTEFVFDKQCYTAHILISEYEHVILFDDYSADTLLIYDSFIGQQTANVFINGVKQSTFTGRPDFTGHYLFVNQMKKNIESSVGDIIKIYDSDNFDVSANTLESARATLGFAEKKYFRDRQATPSTEFRFWQGMIANKGTNLAIDAYINSASYGNARLDEYWAYRVATYGDARKIIKTDLRIDPAECLYTDTTVYSLIEGDETSSTYIEQPPELAIQIQTGDDKRWYEYEDLNSLPAIEAAVIYEGFAMIDTVGQRIDIPVATDMIELIDYGFLSDTDAYDITPYDYSTFDNADELSKTSNTVYYEQGAVQPDGSFTLSVFERINSNLIQLTTNELIGRSVKIRGYGPAATRYSPHKIIDIQSDIQVKHDIIWWDPARGVHHPRALTSIDLIDQSNPAIYNQQLSGGTEHQRIWDETKVGTVWWNTNMTWWKPYYDVNLNNFNERMVTWGSLSDVSTIEVYEWIKSNVPPEKHVVSDLTGEVAIKPHVARNRTWWQRPVAWRYSDNPANEARSFKVKDTDVSTINGITILGASGGNGQVILLSLNSSFSVLDLNKNDKITGITYTDESKTTISTIKGTAIITGLSDYIVGNNTEIDNNVIDVHPDAFGSGPSMTVLVDKTASRQNLVGKYVLTYVPNNRIEIGNTSNNLYETGLPEIQAHLDLVCYQFDELTEEHTEIDRQSVYLSEIDNYTFNFDRLGIKLAAVDIEQFSNDDDIQYEFYVRSTLPVTVTIPFTSQSTYTTGSTATTGWVAWKDPIINPTKQQKPPYNKYEPLVGNWVKVDNMLQYVNDDISDRMQDPWLWFDGQDVTPYKCTWSDWVELKSTVMSRRFGIINTDSVATFMSTYFTITDTTVTVDRLKVLINESLIKPSRISLSAGVITINQLVLNAGDNVKVIITPYVPSFDELKFDPTIDDTDALKIIQYKVDYPHVVEVRRGTHDKLNKYNYYYWVKNKTIPNDPSRYPIKTVAQKLMTYDDIYAIPQCLKHLDQVDGRPYRYGVLVVKKLGNIVRSANRYVLRVEDNPTIRNDDKNISLKNVHTEWALICQSQQTKIPKTLWDNLVDTLTGSTVMNEILPNPSRTLFDERNMSSSQYGFEKGQVMTDQSTAIKTIKYIIQNPKTSKYVNGIETPDYLNYVGFDLTQLDMYFENSVTIRKFMSDVWRYASISQINEIFFEVLYDMAASDMTMKDLFKTSFISLSDIRTVTTES